MDEEAIDRVYQLAVSKGYKKSKDEFLKLIQTDLQAFDEAYKLAVADGYKKSIDDFKYIMLGEGEPVKKKEEQQQGSLPQYVTQEEVTPPQPTPEIQPEVQEKVDVNLVSPSEVGSLGLRRDGTEKGNGYFGPLKRPDGDISTELSIGVEFDGKEMEIPTLVPTLTQDEINYLLSTAPEKIQESNPEMYQSIEQKAVDHAKKRMGEGKDVFAEKNEPPIVSPEIKPEEKKGGVGKEVVAQLESGSAKLGSMFGILGDVYDLFGAPFRLAGIDVPYYEDSPLFKEVEIAGQDINPLSLLNKVKDYYINRGIALDKYVRQINPDIDKGFIGEMSEGDVGGSFRNLFSSLSQSLPSSIAMMMGGGASTATQIGMGAAMFGGQTYEQALAEGEAVEGYKGKSGKMLPEKVMPQETPTYQEEEVPAEEQQRKFSRDGLILVSAVTGALESVFETLMGSGAAGRAVKQMIINTGEDAVEKQAKKGIKNAFVDAVIENPWLAPFGESYEEMATQVSQNIVNKYSGRQPDLNLMDGVWESGIQGFAMGGVFSGVIGGTKTVVKAKSKQHEKANEKIREMAKVFANIEGVAASPVSDEKILKWSETMFSLGRINEDERNKIQDVVALHIEATDLLKVGEENGKIPSVPVVTRLMDLLYAKKELSKNESRQEAYKDKISAVNNEISWISINKTLANGVTVDGNPILVSDIGDIVAPMHQGLPVYEINGRVLTKDKFIKAIDRMRPADLLKAAITINNDISTTNILKQKIDAIQKQSAETGVLRQERPQMELQGMGEVNAQGEKVAGEITPEEGPITEEERLINEKVDKHIAEGITDGGEIKSPKHTKSVAEKIISVIPDMRKAFAENDKTLVRKLVKGIIKDIRNDKSFRTGTGLYNGLDRLQQMLITLSANTENIDWTQIKMERDANGRLTGNEIIGDSFNIQLKVLEGVSKRIINEIAPEKVSSKTPISEENVISLSPEEEATRNTKEYETQRRITEQAEIDSRPNPKDKNLSSRLAGLVARIRAKRGVSRQSVSRTATIDGIDVNINSEITLSEDISNKLKAKFTGFLGVQKIFTITNGDAFRALLIRSLENNPYRACVTVHTVDRYNGMRMYITEDGTTGMAITEDGELVSAFSRALGTPHPESVSQPFRPFNLSQMLILGIKEGASTIECFATTLPNYYSKFGFKMVSRTAFNEEYAPSINNGALADWDYKLYNRWNDGKPDVVFGIFDGGDRETIEDRIMNFENYHEYQVQYTESFDKDGFDDAERVMHIQAIKRLEYEEERPEREEALLTEVADLQNIIGVKEGVEGKFRFQTKEESSAINQGDVDAITDEMNKMPAMEVNFTTPEVSRNITVDPISESESTTKITEEEARELGFEDISDITKPIEYFNGIPMIMGVSDLLATGTVKDSQKKDMKVGGGLLFNLFGRFKNFAWSSTDATKSNTQYKAARRIYNNNKDLFDALWKEGKIPYGYIPMAIIRMADNAVNSNEAIFRWILPTILKQSVKNRKNALNAFNDSITKKIATLEERIKRNEGKVSKDVLRSLSDLKSVREFVKNNNVKTLDELLNKVLEDAVKTEASGKQGYKVKLSLFSRATIFENIFSTPEAKKATGPVVKALFSGNLKSKDANNFVASVVYKAIGEPAMLKTRVGEIMAIMGVDVMNGGVEQIDHGNYNFGVKGRLIALISNPKHGIDVFPEMRAKVSRIAKLNKSGGMPSAERISREVVGSVAPAADKAFIGSRPQVGKMSDLDVLIGKLRFAFPSVTVSTSQEEFNTIIRQEGVRVRQKNGVTIYGITKGGKIYLNPHAFALSTPIHEFGHIWIDYLRSNISGEKGTQLLERGLKLVEGTLEHKRAILKYGDNALALEEALVELMAVKGETIIRAAQKSNFKSWMNAVFKYIRDTFITTENLFKNPKFNEAIKALSLDEFVNIGLADLFAGREVNKNFNPEDAINAAVERFDAEPRPLTMQEIIDKGRREGFSDAAIKEVLKVRGFTATEINNAMRIQVDLFSELPNEFHNVMGGVIEGMRIFTDVRAKLNDYLNANQNATKAATREKALELLKSNDIFKRQTRIVQESLLVALDRTLGIRGNTTVQREISALRNNIMQRKVGETNLRNAQAVINNFIRENLPKSGTYTQAQINKLISIINKTTVDNFNAQAERVLNEIIKQREKMRGALIGKLRQLIAKKSRAVITSSGKRRSGGVSYQAHAFFVAAKPIIDAAIKNDTVTLEKIFEEINDQEEVDKVMAKIANGQELTTREQVIVDKAKAYDMFAGIGDMGLEEIQELYDEMVEIRHQGIMQLNANRLARSLEAEALRAEAVSQIQTGYPIIYKEVEVETEVDGEKVTEKQKILKNSNQIYQDKHKIYKAFREWKIWEGLKKFYDLYNLHTLGGIKALFIKNLTHLQTLCTLLDRGGDFFTKNIFDALNVMNDNFFINRYKTIDKINKIANSIEGIKKGYKQIMYELGSKGWQTVIINGEEVQLSAGQLMFLYAVSKNDVQRAKLEKQNGIGEKELEEFKRLIGPQAVEFADKLVEFFTYEYFEEVNKVFRYVNDVNLGWLSNYFPTKTIARQVKAKDMIDGTFSGVFTAEVASALKERTDVTGEINEKYDFFDVLEDHVESMERFKAYAAGVKRINAIFQSKDVITLLEETGLKPIFKLKINHAILPMRIVHDYSTKILNQFTSYALAFKLMQIPKQATSFLNSFEDYQFLKNHKIDALDFVMWCAESAKLMLNFPNEFKKAYETSATFRERVDEGLMGNIAALESGFNIRIPVTKKGGLKGKTVRGTKSAMGATTMIGDLWGVMGYWVNYKRDIANGMSQEEALKKFNDYNLTAQSRRQTEKIGLQQSDNSLVRVFTMFGSTTFLQINKVMTGYMRVLRAAKKGKYDSKGVRAIIINLGATNALFILASYLPKLIRGDDDDKRDVWRELIKALSGVMLIEQIPLIGAAFEAILNKVSGDRRPVREIVNPYLAIEQKIEKGLKEENPLKAAKPMFEMMLGTQVDPAIGAYKLATGKGKTEDNIYDIIGLAPSYRPKNEGSKGKGMTKEDMKRYFPDLYDEFYGKGSPTYDIDQENKAEEKEWHDELRREKDDAYNYVPPPKKQKEEKTKSKFPKRVTPAEKAKREREKNR